MKKIELEFHRGIDKIPENVDIDEQITGDKNAYRCETIIANIGADWRCGNIMNGCTPDHETFYFLDCFSEDDGQRIEFKDLYLWASLDPVANYNTELFYKDYPHLEEKDDK